MDKKKILLVYTAFSTFVQKDYEILSKEFTVIKYQFNPSKKLIPMTLELIKLMFHLVANIVTLDILYCWFADFHSLLPTLFARLFKKRSVIIVGGFDAVAIPEIDFGVFIKNFRGSFAKYSFQLTDLILPVDESLIDSTNTYLNDIAMPIGIKHFVKKIKAKIQTLPTGYDYNKWKRNERVIREDIVLSIGIAPNWSIYKRKGFDLLFEIARIRTNTHFIIVGITEEMRKLIEPDIPTNAELISFIPNEDLPNLFSRAKVFCQLSLSEGLPNTLCEAMLCECIAVGSNVNGIPKAIGNNGFILESRDPVKGAKLIEQAIKAENDIGVLGRKRIMNLFPHEKRERELLQMINEL